MVAGLHLTVRETAELSGVGFKTVEKAVDNRIVRAVIKPSLKTRKMRYLPLNAVVFFSALDVDVLKGLSVARKRELWKKLEKLDTRRLGTIEIAHGLSLDLGVLSAEPAERARDYTEARDRYIECHADILGGTPVIRGTRLTVYAVKARIDAGEPVDELIDDYPEVPVAAIEAANLYARAHPMLGRPSAGKPWREAA